MSKNFSSFLSTSSLIALSFLVATTTLPQKASAFTVTGATLVGPNVIPKGGKAIYTWTLTGNGAGRILGTPLNWSVYEQDPVFDDELIGETAFVVTDDAMGNFTFTQDFELECTEDCLVKGKDGQTDGESGNGEPAKVFVLFEGKFGGNVAMTNIIDVLCKTQAEIDKQARLRRDPSSHGSGNPIMASIIEYDDQGILSFNNMSITNLQLTGGVPSSNDPLEGATISIGNTSLIEPTSNGWLFGNTTVQYTIDGIPVLTADLVDNTLFIGGGDHPELDSEFQGNLANITINNSIQSAYLDDLQAWIDSGQSSHLSFYSNILSNTLNLTTSSSSTGIVWIDGTNVPEPTSNLSLLALGTLGAASTLKRKLNQKSTETTKVS